MKSNATSINISYLLFIISFIVALIAFPFVLIAGLGLILSLPFGLFAKQELKIINKLKTKTKITSHEWKYRNKIIFACGAGVNIILLLILIANISNTELRMSIKIQPLIICNLLFIVFATLANITKIYSEKKS